jgi:chromosome segregation ATPase
MSEPTVPAQLDTILSTLGSLQQGLGSMHERLNEGDLRMNEADRARAEMNDTLATHTLMMREQSSHLTEQDDKLLTIGKSMEQLAVAMAANTEITTTVKDALTAARVGRTVLIWTAGIVGAAGTIFGAGKSFGWF